jgi:hypothetical protein
MDWLAALAAKRSLIWGGGLAPYRARGQGRFFRILNSIVHQKQPRFNHLYRDGEGAGDRPSVRQRRMDGVREGAVPARFPGGVHKPFAGGMFGGAIVIHAD